VFWIDAICINQDDVPERNKQVLRMRDIYSLADTVQVWLGKADENSYTAMDLVGQLAEVVQDPEDMLANGLQNSHRDTWEELFEASKPSTIRALNQLFQRSWWTRVWVVQELSLANQVRARVRCGHRTLKWLDFLIVAYAIEECWFIADAIVKQEYLEEKLSGFQNGIRMAQCRYVKATDPKYHLLELLHQHRDCEATDKRDKVYGLLGLSGDGEHNRVNVDYGLSPQQIYADVFKKQVSATGSLDIICGCRFPRNFDDLPTWVPDWSTDQLVPGICINERYCGGDAFEGSPIAHFEKYAAAGSSTAVVTWSESGSHMSVR
jgi:hypothetical protein